MTPEEISHSIEHGDSYLRLRPPPSYREGEFQEIVLGNRLWFSSVRDQDDIFEGRPAFRWRAELPSWAEVVELARRNMRGAAPDDVLLMANQIFENSRNEAYMAPNRIAMEDRLAAMYAESSIVSFFRDPFEQQYWAQYADRGRGYGLVFDFSAPWSFESAPGLGPIDMVPFPVNYVAPGNRPTIELAIAPADPERMFLDLQSALLTKSNAWQAQREERLIRTGIPAGHVAFPAQSLSAVILGYRFPDDELEFVVNFINQRELGIDLFKVVEVPGSYRLAIQHA